MLSSIPIIGNLFEKLGDAVDKNVTSDEERLQLKAQLSSIYTPLLSNVLEAQTSNNEMQARIAEAELKSDSWLAKNRRPIVSLISVLNFVLIVPIFDTMTAEQALQFAMLVNGLDTGSRGLEKLAKTLKSKEII